MVCLSTCLSTTCTAIDDDVGCENDSDDDDHDDGGGDLHMNAICLCALPMLKYE